MGSCSQHHECNDTGDRLIHQTERGPHESSSAWGQHIHDNYQRSFTFGDIDGFIYWRDAASDQRVVRIVEQKYPGQHPGYAQGSALRVLAGIVNTAIHWIPSLHPSSGVFLYESRDFTKGRLWRLNPTKDRTPLGEISGELLERFETGKPAEELLP